MVLPRDWETVVNQLIYLFGISLTVYTIYFAWALPFDRQRHSNIFLGVGLALFYLIQISQLISDEKSSTAYSAPEVERPTASTRFETIKQPLRRLDSNNRLNVVICTLFVVLSIGLAIYMELHWERFMFDAHIQGYTQIDNIIGFGILLLVVDSTRRAFGNLIAGVIVISIIYGMFGSLFPGIFHHSGMDIGQMLRYAVLDLSGVYGFILGVGTTWVAIFIMFAGIAKAYGLMDLILAFGEELKKTLRSGVVHVAIISSMVMGSITGSAAANTATTGSFTIPLMQQQGIQDDFAAAIESVASSGGQIMPPIMGVAAFLMADILGVAYVEILIAGVLPAVLFYFSVALTAQYIIYKHGWTSDESGTFDRSIFWQGIHFIVPLLVLVYTLVVLRWTPLSAGFYTILAIIGTMFVKNLLTHGVPSYKETTKQSFEGLKQGAVDMAPLIPILAGLGVIVSMVTQSGLSQKISFQMISIAGGVLLAVLVLAMFTSILFGLGMPTPAAYILVVILAAPPLVEMGIPELGAHFFVFYYAMLSAVTPPVALAVAVGARIGGADFIQSCIQALRIAAIPFLLPFIFVFNTNLLFWEFPMTIINLGVIAIGIIGVVYASVGYDGKQTLSTPVRAAYVVFAIIAFFGPVWLMLIGVLGIAGLKFRSMELPIKQYIPALK